LKLIIAASEAIPYAKTGGLADVTGALPQEFAKQGHDVILLLPGYRSISETGRQFRRVAAITVPSSSGRTEGVVEEDTTPMEVRGGRLRVWVIRQDAFFDRPGLYQEQGRDYPDNLRRFAWFSRAVIEVTAFLRREQGWGADLLHLHDWQTALCAVYLKGVDQDRQDVRGVRTILTLHNVGYQGIFPGGQFESTGLPSSLFGLDGLEFYGSINLLKGGMMFADHLTTVSPTYAKEILTPDFGFGLEGVLRRRQDRLKGIINGIDIDRWNPESDPFLPSNYSAKDLAGKALCKRALQREFGLPEKPVPLLAVVSRLASQKGIDLLEAAIPELMKMKLQFVMLGTGEPEHEAELRTLQSRYPFALGLRIGFDEGLAHRIEGGADIFVMPSRYEPCGLSQMYSLRYGTVPVVTRTGGLADTVVPWGPESMRAGLATGFQVTELTVEGLLKALRQAIELYRDRTKWGQLLQAGMNADLSWTRSARSYQELFRVVLREQPID
jgi:starch synthase